MQFTYVDYLNRKSGVLKSQARICRCVMERSEINFLKLLSFKFLLGIYNKIIIHWKSVCVYNCALCQNKKTIKS